MIALAVYFCIADAILIAQCLYYNYLNTRAPQKEVLNGRSREDIRPTTPAADPTTPLIQRVGTGGSGDNIGLPGSRRRSSASVRRRGSTVPSPLLPTIEEEPSALRASLTNAGAISGICVLGCLGWVFAWKVGWWQPTPTGNDNNAPPRILGAEILGYVSAIAYLG